MAASLVARSVSPSNATVVPPSSGAEAVVRREDRVDERVFGGEKIFDIAPRIENDLVDEPLRFPRHRRLHHVEIRNGRPDRPEHFLVAGPLAEELRERLVPLRRLL